MIKVDFDQKHYGSARRRFLIPMLACLLERELVRTGPQLSRMLAERIVELLDAISPETTRLQPGQMLWCALDKETRGGARNERTLPIVLTLLSEQDAVDLAGGLGVKTIRKRAVARMFKEAYAQDALLSSRDLGMILHVHNSTASVIRKEAEAEIGEPLPHPGILHDMGSTITHKVDIIRKAICERMDPCDVGRATKHSQNSVDRYLKDFQRIRAIYRLEPDITFIKMATGYSVGLIKQYIKIIKEMESNDHETEN